MEKCDCMKKVPGCVRVQQPKCPFIAVIPTVTVEDITGLKELADCFVHVLNINTTFYIDDKHRIITTWAGPVEVEDYDIEANELNLRSQFCFTTVNDKYTSVYFDKQGVAHVIGTEE